MQLQQHIETLTQNQLEEYLIKSLKHQNGYYTTLIVKKDELKHVVIEDSDTIFEFVNGHVERLKYLNENNDEFEPTEEDDEFDFEPDLVVYLIRDVEYDVMVDCDFVAESMLQMIGLDLEKQIQAEIDEKLELEVQKRINWARLSTSSSNHTFTCNLSGITYTLTSDEIRDMIYRVAKYQLRDAESDLLVPNEIFINVNQSENEITAIYARLNKNQIFHTCLNFDDMPIVEPYNQPTLIEKAELEKVETIVA